jgi:hypothetical protein
MKIIARVGGRENIGLATEHKAVGEKLKHFTIRSAEIVFENKITWVRACIDARGHHFQHVL